MDDKRKIVKSFIVFFFIFAVILAIFKFSGRMEIDIPFLEIKQKKENYTQAYKTKVQKSGESSYITFQNVIGTASGGNGVYYNIDLTIETRSDKTAKNINDNKAFAVEAIRTTIGEFRREDVNNEQGRQYMKSKIQAKLNQIYGENAVDNIYLEKFLYQ